MRIGQLAERTGASPRQLRYYEQQGLISPLRQVNGYRDFDEAVVERVHSIMQLLEAGVPTRLIKVLLPCMRDGQRRPDFLTGDMLRELEQLHGRLSARVDCLAEHRDAVRRFLDETETWG
ncbi:MerR family transcriptional regulator [Flexivirga meconopsidis]|uniref:MerR family transcriptional regulator n=1 Tax=Flexivirga meconopsidis TaxID=2977121 RepID=UPI002240370A|nr:MerR family transcriptional regulator [Flexivirga meconopsidis]